VTLASAAPACLVVEGRRAQTFGVDTKSRGPRCGVRKERPAESLSRRRRSPSFLSPIRLY
jgi:hypothetical protein